MVPVKMSDDERARFKVACAEEGNRSYAEMIVAWLDQRDAQLAKARAKQVHPFHRPEG